MQLFELLTTIAFLTMYAGSALRAIIAPASYRAAEIAFYKSGKPALLELAAFVLTGVAFVFLLVHFIIEIPRVSQILLYGMVILFEIMLPFHFLPFFRDRMVSTLSVKTAEKYRSSGLTRLGIAALIILIPLIYGS
ncbi:MAG: hypothetical protein RBU27_03085 [Bacteroidota bacterium]|jgi:hypothetical protein|nr:hypothetical protein [Bacteroidota bacterium]